MSSQDSSLSQQQPQRQQPQKQRFEVGQLVEIEVAPPFVKSADPMPMLRSGAVVQVGDVGRVVLIKPLGTYGVQFAAGTFLIDGRYLGLSKN